ncbi:MAG: glycosyltransferase family 4 protein [Bdellovibrionales bacterium]
MRKPSILFINRVYPPGRGASGRLLRDLARAFARKGWQVTVVTTGPQAVKERDGSVKVIRVKGAEKPGHALSYLWVLVKLSVAALRRPRVDLVVSMTDPPFSVLLGALIKRVKKSKHIHWCQDVYPDLLPVFGYRLPGGVHKVMARITRNAMRRADKVIVIGRCMAKHLGYRGIAPKMMSVIPNWPEGVLLRDAAQDSAAIGDVAVTDKTRFRDYQDQAKTSAKFRILYAGNIGLAHPIDTILEAALVLREEHPEIEFLFVGDGPRYDEISKFRARENLDTIKLLPYQPLHRLKTLMESGDVHLVSMKREAEGMVVPSKVYAAMAAGRPCVFIGPQGSEAARVVQDFKAGCVVEPGNVRDLVRAIRTYRFEADAWFAAQKGATQAGQVFVPKSSINAWISRAEAVLGDVTGGGD